MKKILSGMGLAALFFAGPVYSAEHLESLSGLTMLVEVYVYQPTTFQLKNVARTSVLESMEMYRPESSNWLIRPYKNPAIAFTQPEYRALISWVAKEEVLGLVLDDHPEIGDEDIARLRNVPKLTLLSLRKTSISDESLKTLAHIKTLRYLDISGTRVTAKGLAALKSLKLEKMAYDTTQITPEEFNAFQAQRSQKVALLPKEWSSAWDASRNPDPISETSFFAGATPDEGIPGYLPKGKFIFDYNLPLKSLEGNPVNLSSEKGKVLFINIWTTDCVACRSEVQALVNLYQTVKNSRFFFAYVAPQPASEVKAYLDQQPRNLPVMIAEEKALARYTLNGLPATLIVSKKGAWVVHRNGASKWDGPEIINFLNKLIQE